MEELGNARSHGEMGCLVERTYKTASDASRTAASVCVRSVTTASACGECGLVEITVDDPQALWDAHAERLMNSE